MDAIYKGDAQRHTAHERPERDIPQNIRYGPGPHHQRHRREDAKDYEQQVRVVEFCLGDFGRF